MSQAVCTGIDANADISGVGVRINLYSTVGLLAIIPHAPYTEQLSDALYFNAALSFLGLFLAALMQTAQHKLSLFHALFIHHILFVFGSTTTSLGKYGWSRGHAVTTAVVQSASIIAFGAWSIFLILHIPSFGPQQQCNRAIKYVLLFVSQDSGISFLHSAFVGHVSAMTGLIMIYFVVTVLPAMQGKPRPPWQPPFLSLPFLLLLGNTIYTIVMLELTVQRNFKAHGGVIDPDPDEWAFGQILSIIMIFMNLMEVIQFFFRYFPSTVWKGRKWARHLRRRSHLRQEEPLFLRASPPATAEWPGGMGGAGIDHVRDSTRGSPQAIIKTRKTL
ncbi:hypothetical protein BC834DRAFT_971181 [Gloeopeniophorella convolvens]|nr:hypothetical protein BC834DRAFT_971181 [Gloeopeniophorella convolvens]